jgi:phosphoglycolate phosphatase-like HAD superfamily hydrolase
MTSGSDTPWLMLWDIDHTLLETRGLGSELYRSAFEKATGMEMQRQADVTGQTEPSILKATLRLHGIDEDEPYLSRYKEALTREYEQHQDELRSRGRILPGARDVLMAFAVEPNVVQSVLSGNLRSVSEIKLRAFSLDQYLDLEVGAYGDDATDRPELVAIAQGRAHKKYGEEFTRLNTVVIGDSTHDVKTGQRGGARSIGVASGGDSIGTLRDAGADAVWPDLTDTDRARSTLLRLAS